MKFLPGDSGITSAGNFVLKSTASGKTISIGGSNNEAIYLPGTGTLTVTGLVAGQIDTGFSGAGTDNTGATWIRKQVTIFNTVGANSGGIFINAYPAGAAITVANKGANALKVYPTSGKQIDALTVTTGAYSIAAGSTVRFVYDGTQYWSLD